MRTIRFRMWDNLVKAFSICGPDFSNAWGLGFGAHEFTGHNPGTPINQTYCVQQFTGLKDKTGKDVYEGDIVQYSFYNGHEYIIGIVEWDKYADDEYVNNLETWMVISKSGRGPLSSIINDAGFGYSFFRDIDKDSLKIIGNIFDNPELKTW